MVSCFKSPRDPFHLSHTGPTDMSRKPQSLEKRPAARCGRRRTCTSAASLVSYSPAALTTYSLGTSSERVVSSVLKMQQRKLRSRNCQDNGVRKTSTRQPQTHQAPRVALDHAKRSTASSPMSHKVSIQSRVRIYLCGTAQCLLIRKHAELLGSTDESEAPLSARGSGKLTVESGEHGLEESPTLDERGDESSHSPSHDEG